MPEYSFEIRDDRQRLGYAIALAPSARSARQRILTGLVEQEVGQRRELRLIMQPPPDLTTCKEQIWITQAAFECRFEPALSEGVVAYLSDWEPDRLNRAARNGRLWTLVGSEVPTLVSGFHFVNRLEYLECEIPHLGPAMIVVM